MAPKRPSAVENPPSPSPSSSEEELTDSDHQLTPDHPNNPDSGEDTDNEVESSEEEEEEIQEKNTLSVQKSAPAQSESDDDSSSSDTEPTVPASTVTKKPFVSVSKPPVSKPKPDAKKAPKKANNPSAQKSASPQPNSDDDVSSSDTNSTNTASAATGKPPVSKPPLPKQAVSETKPEAKKSPMKGDEKRSPIVRIFSEDDVLGILRWMIQCQKKRVDPCADLAAFHEFMKGSLHVSLTKSQLSEKIRRLKKKYITNVEKGEGCLKSKPHELKLFELSKEVWGEDALVESKAKNVKRKITNGVSVKVEEGGNKRAKKTLDVLEAKKEVAPEEKKEVAPGEFIKVDEQEFWDSYPRFRDAMEKECCGLFSKEVKREMISVLSRNGAAKAKEMEEKWKAYQAKEIELKLLRMELIKEQYEMVLDVLKKP